jgi:hypothetical protein
MEELDELRLRIAKAQGYRVATFGIMEYASLFPPGEVIPDNATTLDLADYLDSVPDWTGNIADAWELEDELPDDGRQQYLMSLYRLITPEILGGVPDNPTQAEIDKANNDYIWALVHATPEQRCRAYLAWKEEQAVEGGG